MVQRPFHRPLKPSGGLGPGVAGAQPSVRVPGAGRVGTDTRDDTLGAGPVANQNAATRLRDIHTQQVPRLAPRQPSCSSSRRRERRSRLASRPACRARHVGMVVNPRLLAWYSSCRSGGPGDSGVVASERLALPVAEGSLVCQPPLLSLSRETPLVAHWSSSSERLPSTASRRLSGGTR